MTDWGRIAVEPVRRALLDWFASRGRRLPGRESREPWRVLVVEVMSQQTQIERSLAAADAFLARFPGPASLAAATQADAVRAWAGLGYNRRAIHLHGAARAIVERHGGRVPADLEALTALPGVGPYTARAVAARAHGKPVGPVDVNVRRVLGRVLDDGSREATQALADELAGGGTDDVAPAQRAGRSLAEPGRVADALMDLAALVCRPRSPDCPACPLVTWCAARNRDAIATDRDAVRARGRVAAVSVRPPFRDTRRWLRGQLLREVRRLEPGAWIAIVGSRGRHDDGAVREALAALAREGFVELDGVRARLAE